MPGKRPIRIGSIAGGVGDQHHAFYRMVTQGPVDAVVGDWLSEMNIAWRAMSMQSDPKTGYEIGFLQQLEQSIDVVVEKGIKVVTNAGALNTLELARQVELLSEKRGHGKKLVVASVLGDDVTPLLKENPELRGEWTHLDNDDLTLADWPFEPLSACAYIGAWGIVAALRAGADIVICGRVCDASPVIGLAAWWYGWKEDDFDELAGALIAGHIIECGAYATGSNFSGFKEYLDDLVDLGFPIAEVQPNGDSIVTKHDIANGIVTKFNITAQLLYELQGTLYLNPDVVADLTTISITQEAKNRVLVSGVKGLPPPKTTKLIVSAIGGYQAEASFFINGLDPEAKAQMVTNQLKHALKPANLSKLSIEVYGSQAADPRTQNSGTLYLRVFAQARKLEEISAPKFKEPVYAVRMQTYPGYHVNLDFRTMDPKMFVELFAAVVPLDILDHHVLIGSKRVATVSGPKAPASKSETRTALYPTIRPSHDTENAVPLDKFGPTQRAPLGSIVHARSGDKGDNVNIGLFVRHEDEYPWLQSFLTIARIKELFADDWKEQHRAERCEMPSIWAVHFRVLNFLDGGISSSSRIDILGKGVGEYIRSKIVDVPVKFLERGWI